MPGPDPTRRLIRALERAGNAAGVDIAWAPVTAAPWAAGLFVGARHRLHGLAAPGSALDTFLAALPEADLKLPGAHVADLMIEIDQGIDEVRIDARVLVIADGCA